MTCKLRFMQRTSHQQGCFLGHIRPHLPANFFGSGGSFPAWYSKPASEDNHLPFRFQRNHKSSIKQNFYSTSPVK